ncbi:hypothetical protein FSST1_000136 [Fusarium sambucinum]
MEPSSTTRLPNDILFIIFSHSCLHCQDHYNQSWDDRPLRAIKPCRPKQQPDEKSWYSIDRDTLFAVCLASKRLRDVAQPILYHEFVLGYGDSWKSNMYDWGGRLASFMQTLARRPDLSRQVKVVYINTLLFKPNEEGNRSALLEAAQAMKIDLPAVWKRRASKIPASEAQDWPEVYPIFLSSYLDDSRDLTERQERHLRWAMNESSAPAWRWLNSELIATLIAQTHCVQYLSLQGNHTWPTCGLPGSSLRSLGVANLPLKTLDLGVGANSLIELAPALQTLNLHQYKGDLRSWDIELPCLKTLRITDTFLSANSIRRLLNACTGGLTAFEFESYKDDESPRCGYEGNPPIPPDMLHDNHFQPSDVIEILQKHKSTLRVLHLDLTTRRFHMRKIPLEVNLKNFTTLRHIFINAIPLFGLRREQNSDSGMLTRFLPRSIVSLVIYRETLDRRRLIDGALFASADSKFQSQDKFPFLSHVGCNLACTLERDLTTESSLLSLFEPAGVNFCTTVESLSKLKPYLNGPNGSSRLRLPNWDSDDDL